MRSKRQIALCLIHDGAQPGPAVADPVRFGLQDTKGEVHPSSLQADGLQRFEFAVEVRGEAAAGLPVFGGPFCQGPPVARFVYLSWKRVGAHAASWAWRIKVPLIGIGWPMIGQAEAEGCLEADVRDRRPHVTGPVAWAVRARRMRA